MASAPYDNEQLPNENIYPPSSAFSWPHGLLNALRLVFLFGVFICRFLTFIVPILAIPYGPTIRIPTTASDYIFLFIFFGLPLAEAVYTNFHHLQKGTFWSFCLLFYPIYICIYLPNTIATSNLIQQAGLIINTLTTLGSMLLHGQMIFSILVLLICPIHYLVNRTWVMALFNLKYVCSKARFSIQQYQAGNGRNGQI